METKSTQKQTVFVYRNLNISKMAYVRYMCSWQSVPEYCFIGDNEQRMFLLKLLFSKCFPYDRGTFFPVSSMRTFSNMFYKGTFIGNWKWFSTELVLQITRIKMFKVHLFFIMLLLRKSKCISSNYRHRLTSFTRYHLKSGYF